MEAGTILILFVTLCFKVPGPELAFNTSERMKILSS